MIIHYILWTLFMLGSLGRISLLNQTVNFYLFEPIYVVYIASLVWRYRLKPFQKIPTRANKTLIGLLIWSIVSLVISSLQATAQSNIVAILYLVRLVYYVGGGVYIYYVLSRGSVLKHTLLKYSSMVLVLVSLLQYVFYPNLRNLKYLGWDPHQFRLTATFFDTYVAAALFGMFAIHYLLLKKKDLGSKILGTVFLLFGVLTFSRSYIISAIITAVLYISQRSTQKIYVLLACAVLVLLLLAPKPSGEGMNLLRTASIEARLHDYADGIKAWQRSPILGIGYNRIRDVKVSLNSSEDDEVNLALGNGVQANHAGASYHSSFLIILVTTGVVGLALSLYLLFTLSQISVKATVLLIFLGLMSLFDNVLLHPLILFVLPYLLGGDVTKARKAISRRSR